MKFDFDDILIKPQSNTRFISRKLIDPYQENGKLPLIGAPMDTVFSTYDVWNDNESFIVHMPICIPRVTDRILFRWLDLMQRNLDGHMDRYRNSGNYVKSNRLLSYVQAGNFISMSLRQFEVAVDKKVTQIYNNNGKLSSNEISYFDQIMIENKLKLNILIDIANGHMKVLVDVIKKAKEKYGDQLNLMVGNIANPETYRLLSDAGADYIRCSIGSGNACTTSANVAIGYPMASLISECHDISMGLDHPAKIVADGGFRKYSDIIKALALGADYVMIGSLLNKSVEANSEVYWKNIPVPQKWKNWLFKYNFDIYHEYRGMSTKKVQKSWGKKSLTTSEGIVKKNKIEYNINSWFQNFTDYLKSAMSYCDSGDLSEFKSKSEYVLITYNAFKRFDK